MAYAEDNRVLSLVEFPEVMSVQLLQDHRTAVGRQADLERDLLLEEQVPVPGSGKAASVGQVLTQRSVRLIRYLSR